MAKEAPKFNALFYFGVGGVLSLHILFLPFALGAARKHAVPFVTTSHSKIDSIFQALTTTLPKIRKDSARTSLNFVDLGSGDGRVVIAAASAKLGRFHFKKCVGIEVNSTLFLYSVAKGIASPTRKHVQFWKKDIWKTDLRDFDVVMVFGDQRHMGQQQSFGGNFQASLQQISPKIKLSDFDGVSYSLSTPESKTVILLSMIMRCFPELKSYGAEEILRREYGPLFQSVPEPGYDVTLKIDLERLPDDREELIKKLSLLKRNALAAPFEYAFNAQMEKRSTGLMTIHYRDEEAIYISSLEDRVTVIFSTVFKEETDRIFGKVFLQEFVDARRQPAIQSAPQVLYSPKEPPLELRGVPGLVESENVGYVTFVLFPTHFQPGPVREATISRIQLFRDYLHYHIKASKAYMHSRLRARVESFLKVLNRAKPEKPDDLKEKKTASGKTFKRS
ncbi:hypothetical protein HDU97_000074 [Phlyctochytrium planicorne]|nr:hypothetical protein HDU97_000074 [Phlyctochytrium planicorne]